MKITIYGPRITYGRSRGLKAYTPATMSRRRTTRIATTRAPSEVRPAGSHERRRPFPKGSVPRPRSPGRTATAVLLLLLLLRARRRRRRVSNGRSYEIRVRRLRIIAATRHRRRLDYGRRLVHRVVALLTSRRPAGAPRDVNDIHATFARLS